MTDLPQWAMEKAEAAIGMTFLDGPMHSILVIDIARALVEAEARGIERAAKVAEETTQAPPQRNSKDLWIEDIGRRVSVAIRKLMEKNE